MPLAVTARALAPAASRVLAIDDDPRELRLLAQMLRGERLRLYAALNGRGGFERALACAPDLVLLDLRMPGMDGRATLRLFKADPRLAAVPVLLLTASHDIDDKLAAFALGAVDYITKPFAGREVAARVRVHLALARAAHSVPRVDNAGTTDLAPAPQDRDRGADFVRRAQALLLRDLRQAPTLPALAHAVGTNERRLTEEFRRRLGTPVFEYLREERMARACAALLGGEASIAQVARDAGYRTAAAFTYAFRQRFGVTPREFRASGGLQAMMRR